jgi:hypothetical protein
LLKSQTFGLGQTIWADKFLGSFRPIYKHPFWYCQSQMSPFSMFSIIQPLFLQKN